MRREKGPPASQADQEQITRRLMLRMVAEAFRVMEEGVARCPVDVATVLGIGFPDFRGGILKYAGDLGWKEVCRDLDEFSGRHGQRFAPCRLLRETKGDA